MGDMAESFKAINERRKERHANMFTKNVQIIDQSGMKYEWSSNDKTCMLFRDGIKIDFYPHTGRWKYNNKMHKGGAGKMILFIKKMLS